VPEKTQRKNTKVGKVRVEPKTIGIAAVTFNHQTGCRTSFSWQSDVFLDIASHHETESSTTVQIAPADPLPPEYRR